MSPVVTLYQFRYQDVSALMHHTPQHLAPRARCRASPRDVRVIGVHGVLFHWFEGGRGRVSVISQLYLTKLFAADGVCKF